MLAAGIVAGGAVAPAGAATAVFPHSITIANPCGGPDVTAAGRSTAQITNLLVARYVSVRTQLAATGIRVTGLSDRLFGAANAGPYTLLPAALTWVTPAGTFLQNVTITVQNTGSTPTTVVYVLGTSTCVARATT
jgi:hypothetical protein